MEIAVGAVLALLGVLAFRTIRPPPTPSPPPPPDLLPQQVHQLAVMVASLKTQVDGLPSLWETERKRVERDRAAIEQAGRRAKRRLEAGDDGQDAGELVLPPLHGSNGHGGGEAFLPAVRSNVETPEQIAAAAVAREANFARMMGR